MKRETGTSSRKDRLGKSNSRHPPLHHLPPVVETSSDDHSFGIPHLLPPMARGALWQPSSPPPPSPPQLYHSQLPGEFYNIYRYKYIYILFITSFSWSVHDGDASLMAPAITTVAGWHNRPPSFLCHSPSFCQFPQSPPSSTPPPHIPSSVAHTSVEPTAANTHRAVYKSASLIFIVSFAVVATTAAAGCNRQKRQSSGTQYWIFNYCLLPRREIHSS